MKQYTVYFYIKANRTEYLADVSLEAKTAADACKRCKEWYHAKTGKNAFRPTTKLTEESRKWYEDRGLIQRLTA